MTSRADCCAKASRTSRWRNGCWITARIRQMEEEGVVFRCSTNVGVDISAADLEAQFDAVVLAGGSTKPRDISGAGA